MFPGLEASNLLIGAAIVSITLNPLLFRAVAPLERWARVRPEPVPNGIPEERLEPREAAHRAVVVGYGPIGRTVTRLLRENEIEPTVIEMNLDTVRALRQAGVEAILGDATQPAVLSAAGVNGAGSFIVSVAGLVGVEEAFRVARRQTPALQILARTTSLRERRALRSAGADVVASGEGEVALTFTASILERLGATPEQIDRERTRVRTDLERA